MSLVTSIKPRTLAKFAGVFSGVVFGIYWIPLRLMEDTGFVGMWSVMLFNVVAFIIVLPFALTRVRQLIPGRARLNIAALMAGLAYVLYTSAFLYTEVIRVLVLFYLMPLWGFVLARVVIGERITPVRWISMALGLIGLVVVCGIEHGVPLPQNVGDWMALIAGLMWAGVSLSLLTDKPDPVNYTIGFLFWASFLSVIFAVVLTAADVLPFPQWGNFRGVWVWLVPFALLVIVPGAFATMFAPSHINPGVIGLLFMTEISVGTVTAALFAGEPFGLKEITGVVLITLAGIAEPIYQFVTRSAVDSGHSSPHG